MSTAVDPVSCTISHSVVALVTSRSNDAGARLAGWPAGVCVCERANIGATNLLGGGGGSWPSMWRAPRCSQCVSVSPFTSSNPCSVVACVSRVEYT